MLFRFICLSLLSDHYRASLGTSSKFIGSLQFQAHQPGQLLLPRSCAKRRRETRNGIPKTCLWFVLLSWSGFRETSIWAHGLEWLLHFQYVGFEHQSESATGHPFQGNYILIFSSSDALLVLLHFQHWLWLFVHWILCLGLSELKALLVVFHVRLV